MDRKIRGLTMRLQKRHLRWDPDTAANRDAQPYDPGAYLMWGYYDQLQIFAVDDWGCNEPMMSRFFQKAKGRTMEPETFHEEYPLKMIEPEEDWDPADYHGYDFCYRDWRLRDDQHTLAQRCRAVDTGDFVAISMLHFAGDAINAIQKLPDGSRRPLSQSRRLLTRLVRERIVDTARALGISKDMFNDVLHCAVYHSIGFSDMVIVLHTYRLDLASDLLFALRTACVGDLDAGPGAQEAAAGATAASRIPLLATSYMICGCSCALAQDAAARRQIDDGMARMRFSVRFLLREGVTPAAMYNGIITHLTREAVRLRANTDRVRAWMDSPSAAMPPGRLTAARRHLPHIVSPRRRLSQIKSLQRFLPALDRLTQPLPSLQPLKDSLQQLSTWLGNNAGALRAGTSPLPAGLGVELLETLVERAAPLAAVPDLKDGYLPFGNTLSQMYGYSDMLLLPNLPASILLDFYVDPRGFMHPLQHIFRRFLVSVRSSLRRIPDGNTVDVSLGDMPAGAPLYARPTSDHRAAKKSYDGIKVCLKALDAYFAARKEVLMALGSVGIELTPRLHRGMIHVLTLYSDLSQPVHAFELRCMVDPVILSLKCNLGHAQKVLEGLHASWKEARVAVCAARVTANGLEAGHTACITKVKNADVALTDAQQAVATLNAAATRCDSDTPEATRQEAARQAVRDAQAVLVPLRDTLDRVQSEAIRANDAVYVLERKQKELETRIQKHLWDTTQNIYTFRHQFNELLLDLLRADRQFIEGRGMLHSAVGSATKLMFSYSRILQWMVRLFNDHDRHLPSCTYDFLVTSGGTDKIRAEHLFNHLDSKLFAGKLEGGKEVVDLDKPDLAYPNPFIDEQRLILLRLPERLLYRVGPSLYLVLHEMFHYVSFRDRETRAIRIKQSIAAALVRQITMYLYFRPTMQLERRLQKMVDVVPQMEVREALLNDARAFLRERGEAFEVDFRENLYAYFEDTALTKNTGLQAFNAYLEEAHRKLFTEMLQTRHFDVNQWAQHVEKLPPFAMAARYYQDMAALGTHMSRELLKQQVQSAGTSSPMFTAEADLFSQQYMGLNRLSRPLEAMFDELLSIPHYREEQVMRQNGDAAAEPVMENNVDWQAGGLPEGGVLSLRTLIHVIGLVYREVFADCMAYTALDCKPWQYLSFFFYTDELPLGGSLTPDDPQTYLRLGGVLSVCDAAIHKCLDPEQTADEDFEAALDDICEQLEKDLWAYGRWKPYFADDGQQPQPLPENLAHYVKMIRDILTAYREIGLRHGIAGPMEDYARERLAAKRALFSVSPPPKLTELRELFAAGMEMSIDYEANTPGHAAYDAALAGRIHQNQFTAWNLMLNYWLDSAWSDEDAKEVADHGGTA